MSNGFNIDDILADAKVKKNKSGYYSNGSVPRGGRKNLEKRAEDYYREKFFEKPEMKNTSSKLAQAPLFDEELEFNDVDYLSYQEQKFEEIESLREKFVFKKPTQFKKFKETDIPNDAPYKSESISEKFEFSDFTQTGGDIEFDEEPFQSSAVKTSAEIFAEKSIKKDKPFTIDFDNKLDDLGEDEFLNDKYSNIKAFADKEFEEAQDSQEESTDEISKNIFSIKTGLVIRAMLTIILAGLSYYCTLAYTNTSPLPPFMFPEGDTMSMFMWVNISLLVLAALINSNTVWSGIKRFFCFKANSDSLPAFAVLATLAQGVVYASVPQAFFAEKIHLYFPVAILGLLFNNFGKILYIKRVENNFNVACADGERFTCCEIEDRDFVKPLCRGVEMENNKVLYYAKTNRLKNFLEISYTDDQSDDFDRFIAPMCFFGALVVSAVTYFFGKNLFEAVGAFTVVLCMCTPFSSTMALHFPIYKMSNRLSGSEAMVNGYSSVEELAKTDVIVVRANDIFKPKNVILHGIKPMDTSKIDDAIIDAASVLCKCDGTLAEVFFQLVDRNSSILRRVNNIAYMDNLGLSAVVEGHRVLIGNGDLMAMNKVKSPSKDAERRYVRDSRNLVYLSKDGELIAMFVISYKADKKVIDTMNSLTDEGVSLIIYTMDPNITAEKIADVIDIPSDMVKIMPARLQKEFNDVAMEKESTPAYMSFSGGVCSFCDCIRYSISVKSAITLGMVLQIIFIILGYAVATFASFIGWLPMLHFNYVIIYQMVAEVIVVLVSGSKSLK